MALELMRTVYLVGALRLDAAVVLPDLPALAWAHAAVVLRQSALLAGAYNNALGVDVVLVAEPVIVGPGAARVLGDRAEVLAGDRLLSAAQAGVLASRLGHESAACACVAEADLAQLGDAQLGGRADGGEALELARNRLARAQEACCCEANLVLDLAHIRTAGLGLAVTLRDEEGGAGHAIGLASAWLRIAVVRGAERLAGAAELSDAAAILRSVRARNRVNHALACVAGT